MVGIFGGNDFGKGMFRPNFIVWIELLEDSVQMDVYQGAVAVLPKRMVFGLVTNERC